MTLINYWKSSLMVLLFCFGLSGVFGQLTLPGTSPYSQNFNTTPGTSGTSYPTGWISYNGTNADASMELGSSTSTTGGNYNYGSRIGLLASSSAFDPGSIVLRISNTTGLNNLKISYDIIKIREQGRSMKFDLEVSTTSATSGFVAVAGGTYVSGTIAENTSTHYSNLDLSALNNHSGNVWIRWNYTTISGSGSRDGIALDNVSISWSTIPQPANNLCANAENLVIENATTGTLLGATISSPFPYPEPDGGIEKNDVWYKYIPSFSGPHTITLSDFDGDADLSLFEGSCPSMLYEELTDSWTENAIESVTYNLTQGTTYYIRVSGFDTEASQSDFSIEVTPSTVIWTTGNVWSDDMEPTINNDVVIEGDLYLSDYESFEAKSLTVNGSILIENGYSLKVDGIITNNAGASAFIVENGANLVQTQDVENIGNITVIKNSNPMVRNDMTLWSSPVSGQSMRDFSPETLFNRFWLYDEATNDYEQIFAASGDDQNFAEATGYGIRVRNTLPTGQSEVTEGTFTGIPNNGTVQVNVTNTAGGYNSVGNPYPSNIAVSGTGGFLDINSDVNAIYFWTHEWPVLPGNGFAGSNYLAYSTAGSTLGDLDYISAGQGFIVGITTAGTIEFNNQMRTTQAATFHKNENEVERHRLWISISDTTQKLNQMLLAYMDGATTGTDHQIDALVFEKGNAALYNLIENGQYAIQGRALPFENSDIVPLGFNVSEAGSYTIKLENFDGLFAEGQLVYLKDKTLDVIHNLSESAYGFTTEAGEFNERFEIVYKENETMGTGEQNLSSVQVYKHNENIVVSSKAEKIISVELFDIQGRSIHRNEKINANIYQVKSNSKGVLTIKVQTQNGEIVTKKIINY